MISLFIQSLRLFVALTVLLGLGYPLLVTAIGQFAFFKEANGSLIKSGDQIVGSELLAQKIESPMLFWPRPSASDFATLPSGASNLGPTSESLKVAITERKAKGLNDVMLFASGSGLDPHLTLNAALSQIPRIVESRNLDDNGRTQVEGLIRSLVEKRDFGFLGEERVNVMKLNLRLTDTFGK